MKGLSKEFLARFKKEEKRLKEARRVGNKEEERKIVMEKIE